MKSARAWIAYVGSFPFPWGSAGARRVLGVAQSITATGRDVVVCSVGRKESSLVRLDQSLDGPGEISYASVRQVPPTASAPRRALNLLALDGSEAIRWLDRQPTRPSHVIVYGLALSYMARLRTWSRRAHVPIIADVVEWYDLSDLPGGRWGPFAWSTVLGRDVLSRKIDGYIAISRTLEERLTRRGVPVARIPPTLMMADHIVAAPPAPMSLPLDLCYCGTPGSKDLLEAAFVGLARLDPSGQRARLVVVGPPVEMVEKLRTRAGLEPDAVVAKGFLPQVEAQRTVASSDYSILLREPRYSNQAGFSTKFVESLSLGVPVIANLTSDLGKHLCDGSTGWVVRQPTPECFAEALARALKATPEQTTAMRSASIARWRQWFTPTSYVRQIDELLNAVR